eukprot:scaffold2231_cov120-Cylindrotheca_fusiformis.AAC.4
MDEVQPHRAKDRGSFFSVPGRIATAYVYSRCYTLTIPSVTSKMYRYIETIVIIMGVWWLAPHENGGVGGIPPPKWGSWVPPAVQIFNLGHDARVVATLRCRYDTCVAPLAHRPRAVQRR